MASTNIIALVSGFKVRSGAGMAEFIGHVYRAVELEGRRKIGISATLSNMTAQARKVPKGQEAKMAPMFGKLRAWAEGNNAPQVSAAIVPAAAWYYQNIELPGIAGGVKVGRQPKQAAPSFLPSFASEGAPPSAPAPAPAAGAPVPLTQRTWFWPAVIGGAGVVAVSLILLIPARG